MRNCIEALLALLSIGDAQQVEEREIRLAIDILARETLPGFEVRITEPHEPTRRGLLQLMNAHPELRAVAIGDEIVVKKQNPWKP